MDIPNIPQNLIKTLDQKNTEQLVALSRVLNLVLGKAVMATVTSVEPVTEPERQALLKQTAAALAHINKQVVDPTKISPAIKTEISRLMQQQDLIKMPELKWVNLLVNNRTQLTFTDRPLVAGQTVPVQLQSPQKLVLLDTPEAGTSPTTTVNLQNSPQSVLPLASLLSATNHAADADQLVNQTSGIPVPNAKSMAILNELLKNALAEMGSKAIQTADVKVLQAKVDHLILEKNLSASGGSAQETTIKLPAANSASLNPKELSLKFSAETASHKSTPELNATKTLVGESLRTLLPHKDVPNVLYSAITQLGRLPATSRVQLVSSNLEQALKSVAEKIRSPETLSQPRVLAQTLKNSGIFFEHKLNQLIQQDTSSGYTKSSNTLHNTYQQDMKGSLLTLLHHVTEDLTGDKKSLTSDQTQKLLQQVGQTPFFNPSLSPHTLGSKQDLAQAITIFVQQLMQKPVKELSNKELRTQLLVLLQQHSVHSLARIQLQQLHAITHELDTKDSATPNASWQAEIPIRHQNDVQNLHLRIDREWIDAKSESELGAEKTSQKIKQWSVTLRFDLPTLGEFCAQLAIVDTQVSATLWAQKEKTFTKVREHVESLRKQLESEGMNVKFLQCMRGIPPEKPMALSYSLIDVST